MKLEIPKELNRNAPGIVKLGHENTGQFIIETVCKHLGIPNLADKDVLDIGCGTRLTGTFINREIPIKSYTGIESEKKIIDFLSANVKDPRFTYFYWDAHNPTGQPMSQMEKLPCDGDYDIIWLFSVFTHQNPHDTNDLLRLIRKHIRPDGYLVFTAFIGGITKEFEDKHAIHLMNAHYKEDYMKSFINKNGWQIQALYPPDKQEIMQHCFICKPC
jgi:SAM-dependent methyltransferase